MFVARNSAGTTVLSPVLLAGFFVGGVFAIPLAVFLHFDTLAVVRFVLGGDVVATLALLTFKSDRNALI